MNEKENMQELIKKLRKTEHGFKHIEAEAKKIAAETSVEDCLMISDKLLKHEAYQARALAVFILGFISSKSKVALKTLKEKVSLDDNWRVQEILAKAFDKYCSNTGYEKALPVIEEWLKDKRANVRRAVTEGLRIWTGRPYFKEHPEIAIKLLSQLKADESEYVRTSVGNALKDISKKFGALIKAELKTWDLRDKRIMQTYKLASKFIE